MAQLSLAAAIRWDEPTTIYDWIGSFTEVFGRGAFTKTIAERGPLGNSPFHMKL